MGVRGLTTYIYSNSNKFFDNFMLHNSDIIIDGNCLLTVLFQSSITNTASFGGDYDRYAKAVENFFKELLKCNVNPIVIFDGGYERKKLQTVFTRNKNKMLSLRNIGPAHHSKQCFPLMMRQVFRDKLKEMKILYAQSDFEADGEIAALARKLQCPVLSNDSDFFIYDVTLIPVNEFSLEAERHEDGSYYMSCLVYKVERFLKSLGELHKSHLPLLAALLGNDYISTSIFANFYSQMKITRGRKFKDIRSRIKSIILWLKNESYESALSKILWHLKKNRQKEVALKIARIIQGYSKVSTPLDAYVVRNKVEVYPDIEIVKVEYILDQYDSIEPGENVGGEVISDNNSNDSTSETYEDNENDGDLCDNSELEAGQFDKISEFKNPPISDNLLHKGRKADIKEIPPWLIDYSREGNLPSCLITLSTLRIYFCIPQVEDYELGHSGEIGLSVLSKIAGILLGDDIYSYYSRTQKCKYSSNKIPTIVSCGMKQLPNVSNLNQLNNSQRKSLFLDIFEIDSNTLEIVNNFPETWHLFILALVFWAKNIKELSFNSYYLQAVIIMILCVRVTEDKIGYFRNKRPFMQRYASKIKKANINKQPLSFSESESIANIIQVIPLEEYLTAFEIFLPYFQVEERLKTNSKFFSRPTIHAFSQFQVCIDYAYTLNSLLLSPFVCLPVYNFFNATYLYNFCSNFKKRTNLTAYLETLFVKCPSILHLHKKMVDLLCKIIKCSDQPEVLKKRRRKKNTKKSVIPTIIPDDPNNISEDSAYSDEDNAYSLLSKLEIK